LHEITLAILNYLKSSPNIFTSLKHYLVSVHIPEAFSMVCVDSNSAYSTFGKDEKYRNHEKKNIANQQACMYLMVSLWFYSIALCW